MSFGHFVYAGTKRLRCGYTTGSCAAMAAAAACELLLDGRVSKQAHITSASGILISADVQNAGRGTDDNGEWAHAAIQKDAGDDFDATDGLLIYATVRKSTCEGVRIEGGSGVGRVTKPGLDQPVGAAAINSVPREMITGELQRVCAAYGYGGGISVLIEVPGGQEAAARTFNPNLGVVGGISILGTSGIVEPRSLSALKDSIELEIAQHAACGFRSIVVVPGNYGQRFVNERFSLDGVPCVVCSNFIGAAIDACCREHYESVLLVGHIGKLIKVAGGIMDTHSRVADCRLEILAAHAACAGAPTSIVRSVMEATTTSAALATLEAAGLLYVVCQSLSLSLERHLVQRAAGALQIAAVVFGDERRELFRTPNAGGVIEGMGLRDLPETKAAPGKEFALEKEPAFQAKAAPGTKAALGERPVPAKNPELTKNPAPAKKPAPAKNPACAKKPAPAKSLACISFTQRGFDLAQRMKEALCDWNVELAQGFGEHKEALSQWTARAFEESDAVVFVGATGIAVRACAPFIRSKMSDPAVVVIDEGGTWAIPLLSGHIGGANELARTLEQTLGVRAIITTASDIRQLASIDLWAKESNFRIANPAALREIAARLLAGEQLFLYSDVALSRERLSALPCGILPVDARNEADIVVSPFTDAVHPDTFCGDVSCGDVSHASPSRRDASRISASHVNPSYRDTPLGNQAHTPSGNQTLVLVPECIAAGIGCKRGTSSQTIERVFLEACERARVSSLALAYAASIENKADEEGLLRFCEEQHCELRLYSAEELRQTEGSVSPSSFVHSAVGVDNVCERAALAGGNTLVAPKYAHDGVTVAFAQMEPVLFCEDNEELCRG